jgi:hypothetical protein
MEEAKKNGGLQVVRVEHVHVNEGGQALQRQGLAAWKIWMLSQDRCLRNLASQAAGPVSLKILQTLEKPYDRES